MSQDSPSPLGGGQPRYLLLAQALMDDIKAARYPLDSLLPTEHELCQQFGVSRHTVREAIRRLSDLGLIHKQHGIGSRVKAVEVAARYVQAHADIADLHQYVRDVRLDIHGIHDISADAELAQWLECQPGQEWLCVSGLRFREGDQLPLAFTHAYIARAYRSVAEDLGDGREPIYALIERRFGLRVTDVRQDISAVLIDAADAQRLQVAAGSAGLRIIRRYYGHNQELLEVAVSLHPGERFSYSFSQQLKWQGAAS
ncbi:MAG: GntR family transcriptional regulator [Janthinobacterium lividum]|jgi:DNA-binding GntR family transcriptional regulator|uniref:GntR family transcriptional regulator n=1 Tax=Pseudomonas TaxID=286 RepID=UPI0023DEDF86|nr:MULTISPECIES: GntR family transcriptional regulator [Pseudomonas]